MIPLWAIWTFIALVSWGCWAIISKLIGNALTPEASQALSTIGLLPVIIGLALAKPTDARGNKKLGVGLAFASGILTCLGNIAYYALLNSAKAITIVPLTALYPIVTVVLAVLFLKERLNPLQFGGIALALAAIYFFNVPADSESASSVLVLALGPITFWGVSGLVQKISTNHISGELSAIWFLFAFIPVAAILFLRGTEVTASPRTWALAILLGLTFAFGNFAILQAFARGGKASIIAPLAGLYPVVSIPIAIGVLGERISARETIGVITALAAVAAISIETKKA